MSPDGWQEWVAWAGIVLPLFAIAWSAAVFVWTKHEELKVRQYERLQSVMLMVGEGTSIAPRIAAAYELRNFKNYKAVIIRFCEIAQVGGSAGEELMQEIARTKRYLEGK